MGRRSEDDSGVANTSGTSQLLRPAGSAGDYDDDEIVVNPDPEEDELLIEWANERPNVERLRTRNPDPGAFMGDFDIGEFLR